jgi:hypothetical protein
MGVKKKVRFGQEMVDGEEVEFEPLAERWNEYRLSDGTLLKMKMAITKIFRLDKYNDVGEPIYLVSSNTLLSASVRPELMKGEL